MKATKSISKKLIAFILVMTCVFSTTAVAVTSTSALSTSTVLEKTKSYNDLVYGVFSDELKKVSKYVPFASVGLDIIIDLFSNSEEDSQLSQDIEEIKQGISDLQSSVSDIQFTQQVDRTKEFNIKIKEISSIIKSCDSEFNMLKDRLNKYKEDKNEKYFKASCKDIKSDIYKHTEKLFSETFDFVRNYLINNINSTSDASDIQPFVNYFNALLNKQGVNFGKVAKDDVSKYEEKVMNVYGGAVSLYCMVTAMKIDDIKESKMDEEEKLANIDNAKQRFANKIVGTNKDTVEVEITNADGSKNKKDIQVWNNDKKTLTAEYKKTNEYKKTYTYAFDYYNDTVLGYEKSKEKTLYYGNSGNKQTVNIHSVQPCKVDSGKVYASSKVFYDKEMIETLNQSNSKYNECLSILRNYIQDEYINNDENHKQTLREFLKDKGIDFSNGIEKDSYLIVAPVPHETSGNQRFEMDVIKIDKKGANFEKLLFGIVTYNTYSLTTNYIYGGYSHSNLCTFTSNPTIDVVAKLKQEAEETQRIKEAEEMRKKEEKRLKEIEEKRKYYELCKKTARPGDAINRVSM